MTNLKQGEEQSKDAQTCKKKEFMGIPLECLAQLQADSLVHNKSLSVYTCELGYTEKECIELIVGSGREHENRKARIIETLNDANLNPAFNDAFLLLLADKKMFLTDAFLLVDKKMFFTPVHFMFDILYLSHLTAQRSLLKLKGAATNVLDVYVAHYVGRLNKHVWEKT